MPSARCCNAQRGCLDVNKGVPFCTIQVVPGVFIFCGTWEAGANERSGSLLLDVVVRAVPVHVHQGVIVVLDHHVPLSTKLLRLHVVLLGEALLQELERPRDLNDQMRWDGAEQRVTKQPRSGLVRKKKIHFFFNYDKRRLSVRTHQVAQAKAQTLHVPDLERLMCLELPTNLGLYETDGRIAPDRRSKSTRKHQLSMNPTAQQRTDVAPGPIFGLNVKELAGRSVSSLRHPLLPNATANNH